MVESTLGVKYRLCGQSVLSVRMCTDCKPNVSTSVVNVQRMCTRCALGVCSLCTECALKVYSMCTGSVFNVYRLCIQIALGMYTHKAGVHLKCT